MTLAISGQVLEGYYSGEDAALVATISERVDELDLNLARLFTLRGIHDLQHGFSVLLPLSAIGGWLNARRRYPENTGSRAVVAVETKSARATLRPPGF